MITDEEKQLIETLKRSFTRMEAFYKAKSTRIRVYEEKISQLESENADLRERLERAVELPVKVGDTVYLLSQTSRCPAGEIVEAKIIDFIGWEDGYRFTAKGGGGWFSFLRGDIGTWVFTTPEAVLARLAELNGGKE